MSILKIKGPHVKQRFFRNYLYQSIQRRNKYVEICTFFGEGVRHSSKMFKVKKGDTNLSDWNKLQCP